MSDLMVDILDGRIGHREANAVCNAGSKLLRAVELTHKYGTTPDGHGEPTIVLANAPREIASGD